jgi:uncharacterized protein (TIGR00266 family)
MRYDIEGDTTPILSIELEAGEAILSEPGSMIYMDETIEMDTRAEGGLMSSVKRSFSGESFFLTEFSAKSRGEVHFSPTAPGSIIPLSLDENESILTQQDAVICTVEGNIDTGYNTDLAGGFLSGQGFKYTRLKGPENAFIAAGGEVQRFKLDRGQKLKIDTGCLVAFEEKVNVSAEKVGGLKNSLFGGEGLFITTAEGPGTVWVQSMPLPELALEISRYIPTQ